MGGVNIWRHRFVWIVFCFVLVSLLGSGPGVATRAVQAAAAAHQLVPRPQVQVVRVAQHDARVERFQVLLGQGLDRGLGAHGHEDRCGYCSVHGR